MAKSGEISAAGANAPIQAAVTRFQAPVLTLAQITALALGGSDSPLRLIVDPINRTVKVYAANAPFEADGLIDGAKATFTQDDGREKVRPWTGTGDDAEMIELANEEKKASRSLTALVNTLEDALSDTHTIRDYDPAFFVDQVTGKVGLFDQELLDDVAAAAPLATFTQTLPENQSVVHNAFE